MASYLICGLSRRQRPEAQSLAVGRRPGDASDRQKGRHASRDTTAAPAPTNGGWCLKVITLLFKNTVKLFQVSLTVLEHIIGYIK